MTTARSSAPAATLPLFRIAVSPNNPTLDAAVVRAAQQLGIQGITAVFPTRLFFLQGNLTQEDVQTITTRLLSDPVTEQFTILDFRLTIGEHDKSSIVNRQSKIETVLLPGVTDPPAENLLRAAQQLGISGLERAATGQHYRIDGTPTDADLHRLATELLANPVIQQVAINQPIRPPFFAYESRNERVEQIDLRQADDAELEAISQERRLSLNLEEMQAIRAYYRAQDRPATDVELEMIAQTWSEHCVHKTFKAIISYDGPPAGADENAPSESQTINGLINDHLRAATNEINKPWVKSAFVDNAGIVAFDDQFDLAFKVETHNHPSALEPFGGANTGIGGCVRDVLGVSARPIANTDILCFGPPDLPQDELPDGVLHPSRIADGVISGIEDYGNKMGIPTVNGAIHYHKGYTANPLVYCGCLGILPIGSHVTMPQAGDLVIAVGGRTGRDGLRGATFSSMEMDVETSDIAGTAVQIGHPIMEKQVQEVILRARDEQLYTAITDCGAGGYSSAVGEMAETLGAAIQLENVRLKYPGLAPWEIWLSEAQERMVLSVPPANMARLQAICDGQDVELTVLGTFTGNGRLTIHYGDLLVGALDMPFLHDGLPPRHMTAVWTPEEQYSVSSIQYSEPDTEYRIPNTEYHQALLDLLSHPNIRSKESVIRLYDHEVQGGTAVKPLTGVANHAPSDATVLVPHDAQFNRQSKIVNRKSVALANGLAPQFTHIDPYKMAFAAVDEAVRNAVAVGTDPDTIAILDNFCWGNPNLPDRLGALVRCSQGCYDAAIAYQTPFISGKDSLNNEYTGADGQKHAIPGTLLISAMGIVPDVEKAVTMDLKGEGNLLFLVGETKEELRGSHFEEWSIVNRQSSIVNEAMPTPIEEPLVRYRALFAAIQAGLVQSCHDCSEGGLAVALAEMAMGGRIGVRCEVAGEQLSDTAVLFSESLGRLIVEVKPEDAEAFVAQMANVPHSRLGVVEGKRVVVENGRSELLIDLRVSELELAWRGENEPLPIIEKNEEKLSIVNSQLSIVNGESPKVLVLHANGSNRDRDAALACELAGGAPEIVHVNQLLAGERTLNDYQMLVVPGGFSYGDDLGAGVLWSVDLQERLGEMMSQFVENGRPVLGICNGFQTIIKSGLLDPALATESRPVTLTYNERGHFECRWVYLQPNPNSPSIFTKGLNEPIYCPVAHGEGRFAVTDTAVLAELEAKNLVALRYINADGSEASYPANPNGSVADIAGICNPAGNVMGLMPHPENHIFGWQHPRAQRGERGMLGLRLFENGIRYASEF